MGYFIGISNIFNNNSLYKLCKSCHPPDIILDDDLALYTGQWFSEDLGDSQYGSGVHSITKRGRGEAIWQLPINVSGHYKLYIHSPGGDHLARKAHYVVNAAKSQYQLNIDQRHPSQQWQLLGTYFFNETAQQYLKLKNNPNSKKKIIADAIKLTYVEAITLNKSVES